MNDGQICGRRLNPLLNKSVSNNLLTYLCLSLKVGRSLLLPWIPRRREVESHSHCHQLGERVSLHLLHHLASVRLHLDFADSELETDLFILRLRLGVIILMHILSIEAVSKDYGLRPVLENISLGLNSDDRVGVVGVNGSGKTTFLRLVAGDERPDAGRITLAEGVTVGYLPQNPPYAAEATVWRPCSPRATPR